MEAKEPFAIGPNLIMYKPNPNGDGPKNLDELWGWINSNFTACDGWEFIQTGDDEISHRIKEQHAEDHNSI
jgi:hypothetical protein